MSDTPKIAAIERARIEAAERAVVEGIPAYLLARLAVANAEFQAKGGCPGCGSQRIAVHYGLCPTNRDDLY